MYVKPNRNDVSSIALHGGSFTKVGENADGVWLSISAGEMLRHEDSRAIIVPGMEEVYESTSN